MNVLDAALDRIRNIYNTFDTVVVSFSGGKDSTTILQLCLAVAEEMGRLPVETVFIDEEAITFETVEYVERLSLSPKINMRWYCLPVKHRNACSRTEVYWYPWDPDKKSVWVRPMPSCAISSLPGFIKGLHTHAEIISMAYGRKYGRVAEITGLRAQESPRRRAMAENNRAENYIGEKPRKESKQNVWHCYPIYDWTVEDVWLYASLVGFDYNKTYDVLSAYGVPLSKQRCTPPWGEEPLGKLYQYAECFPSLWHKMIDRVPGCNTAGRYALTELYGREQKHPPDGMTWEQWTWLNLERWEGSAKADVAKSIRFAIRAHVKRTARSIPEVYPDPASGVSWRFLAKITILGDFKSRKLQRMLSQGWETLQKIGIDTKEELFSLTDDQLTERLQQWQENQ